MQAVSNHGLTLAYASDELVADHEIVMAAVADCGLALQFADKALRSDYEIVMKAASNEGLAASSASPDLRANAQVVAAALGPGDPASQIRAMRVTAMSGNSCVLFLDVSQRLRVRHFTPLMMDRNKSSLWRHVASL